MFELPFPYSRRLAKIYISAVTVCGQRRIVDNGLNSTSPMYEIGVAMRNFEKLCSSGKCDTALVISNLLKVLHPFPRQELPGVKVLL